VAGEEEEGVCIAIAMGDDDPEGASKADKFKIVPFGSTEAVSY
jgi:hypothetical protein